MPKATLFFRLLMLAVFAWLTERAVAGFTCDSQPIAHMSNSGNTFNSHLHTHAVQGCLLSGKSVPTPFNGQFPARDEPFCRSE